MHDLILAASAVCGLLLSSAAAAQDFDDLDADTALECGVYNSFLGGVLEEDAPATADEFQIYGATWMAMALLRLGGDEDIFNALLETKTDRVAEEFENAADVNEGLEGLIASVEVCEVVRESFEAEFSATMEAMDP